MWHEEVEHYGIDEASVFRVMFRFVRTRVIVTAFVQIGTLTFGLIGPVTISLSVSITTAKLDF